jgi:hypothetical protein
MEQSMHRDRFIAATQDQALDRLAIQSNLAVDAMFTVAAFPYIFTNAGPLAEAAAHWAFVADPSLRVDDDGPAEVSR